MRRERAFKLGVMLALLAYAWCGRASAAESYYADDIERFVMEAIFKWGGIVVIVITALYFVMDKAIGKYFRRLRLDKYLSPSLTVYRNPFNGKKYFKLTISALNDPVALRSVPKEVVFLVDSSLSIQPDRLKGFKQGISACLDRLSPADKFNLIIFKDDMRKFSALSLAADVDIVAQAKRFIDDMDISDSTDIFEAFSEVIRTACALRPSYLFLISDGRPTSGVVDLKEIIIKINRMNRQVRSIYSFSGGTRYNRELLDFISYTNNGQARYSNEIEGIGPLLSAFFDEFNSPFLRNVQFRFINMPTSEVFPKRIGDFHRGGSISFYGVFDKEKEFSFYIKGDVQGEAKEYLCHCDLEDAIEGDETIAKEWAMSKVYFLTDKMAKRIETSEQNVMIDAINALCADYDIVTPFTIDYDLHKKRRTHVTDEDAPPAPPSGP